MPPARHALPLLMLLSAPLLAAPPAADKNPVTDEYHGVAVADPYRWLENWGDPAVKAWSEAQNAHARAYLDALPSVDAIRARITELETSVSTEYGGLREEGGTLFAIKHDPAHEQPTLVVLAGPTPEGERTLVDPNAIDPSGSTTIDWFVPSPDGKRVAVSISAGGTESGTVRVYDAATGKETGDTVPRAHGGTAGGSLAWNSDGTGFAYTRYPAKGERPDADLDFYQQVYFHTLGAPADADTYEMGKDLPKIAEIQLERSDDGRWILANVQKGDGGEYIHFLKDAKGGAWRQFTQYDDRVVHAVFGEDNALYLVSTKNALRGKVLRLDPATPELAKAATLIPEQPDAAIEADFHGHGGVLAAHGRLYVNYQVGGPSVLRVFDLGTGKKVGEVSPSAVATVGPAVGLGDAVLVSSEGFLTPSAWFRYDPATGKTEKTALAQTTPFDFSAYQVERVLAVSKDGTKVPVSIIRAKTTALDGTNPTVLNGYGGYGVNISPGFSARRLAWLEQGGIWAVANIRGGGEFGEDWHLQGNLTNKQNVFDDFHAAARHLIDGRYTSRERLALMGGSNGGLLMGAAFTQHPDLARAVVSSVGIYDMLRVELSPNGLFNVTEFGTVKDASHFKALYAYSPYHHVKDGVDYPSILFMTGANDPRVDPMQSRKMTARLQEADPSGPILLRTSANSGHGVGSSLSERIEQNVDVYAFLFHELGVAYKPVKTGGASAQ